MTRALADASDAETIARSAMVHLLRHGLLTATTPDPHAVVLKWATMYADGVIRFPLFTESAANVALNRIPNAGALVAGLGDLGFKFGKFLKNVAKDLKTHITNPLKAIKGDIKFIPAAIGGISGGPWGVAAAFVLAKTGSMMAKTQQQQQQKKLDNVETAAKAKAVSGAAVALAQRIGLDPAAPATAATLTAYSARLQKATDTASLNAIINQITSEQDASGKYATASGTTINATIASPATAKKPLFGNPLLLAAGAAAAVFAVNQL